MAWAVKKSGQLMPVEMVFDGEEWVTVKAPSGAEYTYPKDRIIPEEDGRLMIRESKVQDVLDHYEFRTVNLRPLMVIVKDRRHPRSAGYGLGQRWTGEYTCNCPDASKRDGVGCKHTEAYSRLQAERRRPVVHEDASVPAKRPVSAGDLVGASGVRQGDW